jgi:pimeloyl-ACP methyl ester carboxylesterase
LLTVGLAVTDDELLANAERRSAEPWFPDAKAAVQLVLAGELDLGPTPERAAEAAALFPAAELAVLPGAAHFPWIDDPAGFATALADFLGPR